MQFKNVGHRHLSISVTEFLKRKTHRLVSTWFLDSHEGRHRSAMSQVCPRRSTCLKSSLPMTGRMFAFDAARYRSRLGMTVLPAMIRLCSNLEVSASRRQRGQRCVNVGSISIGRPHVQRDVIFDSLSRQGRASARS